MVFTAFVTMTAWYGSGRNVAAEESTTAIKSTPYKVDLNSASIRELKQLPGMGPELAERVLQHRPYHKLDELISRKVLGRKEFARIKERIRVNPTQAGNSMP
ncbi:MAG: helix-hairpin-helix domain-containing protein [candidate division NC10 bacterium]|nr:helix-hairpin-helix domain-containing protein [candidate division NC10 bacterium]MDE2322974.1 helix-hairpin-helix domain-containing protein [candidate division NC10 bacterium]